jgi:hypothetical protein
MKQLLFSILFATLFVACEKREQQESQVSNVSWTPCKQGSILKSSGLSDKVDVEFTNRGIQITHYNFEVSCDFTTVNVTHIFANGILNITQQGSPNQADCVCHTDVSYTIDGILQNEVNVIFINGAQVYCYNDNGNTIIEETVFENNKVFNIRGGCETMPYKSIIYVSRLGNDFDSALDSLIKLKEQTNTVSIENCYIETEMITIDFSCDDRLFYIIGFMDSIKHFYVSLDVIDNKGNYFDIIWCED